MICLLHGVYHYEAEVNTGQQAVHVVVTADVQDVSAEYGTVDAQGQIWVALDGGYVVRYTLEATGQFAAYFEGTGTLKLT